jgi:hypothetical protein
VSRNRKTLVSAVPAMVLCIVLALAGCAGPSNAREPMDFSPGSWSNTETGLTLTLNADGSGTASNIPYVPVADFPACPPDGQLATYSGAIEWVHSSSAEVYPSARVYLIDTPGLGSVEFFPWRWPPEDWSRIQTWPCGDPDEVAPHALDRLEP